jgi:hypothetical protein
MRAAASRRETQAHGGNTIMAKLSNDALLDAFKEMTLLELSDFVKQFEDTFAVKAAAPVAVAAPAAGGGGGGEAGRGRLSSTSSSRLARRRSGDQGVRTLPAWA